MICTAALSKGKLSCVSEAREIYRIDIQSSPSHCCHFCSGHTGTQTGCGPPRGDDQPAMTWYSPEEQAAVPEIPDLNDEHACATGVSAGRQTRWTQRSTSALRCLLMGDCSQHMARIQLQSHPMRMMVRWQKDVGRPMPSNLQSWSTPRRWLHESQRQQWKGEGYPKAGCWSPPSGQKDLLPSLLSDKPLSQQLEGEMKTVHLAPRCCCHLHGDTEQFRG